nr:unnamed protein product [Spirometra erinaceieuropaei]
MKQPRSWFTLLTSSNTVFALGNEDGPHNTVEALTAKEVQLTLQVTRNLGLGHPRAQWKRSVGFMEQSAFTCNCQHF